MSGAGGFASRWGTLRGNLWCGAGDERCHWGKTLWKNALPACGERFSKIPFELRPVLRIPRGFGGCRIVQKRRETSLEHDPSGERRLLDALSDGDPAAIAAIYKLYSERIFRYTYRMLNNRTDAEDATAETFLRVIRRSRDLRADGAFRTWLFRIARNLCIDKLRQHQLLELPMDATVGSGEERAALRIAVREALNSLPKDYREPLVLCDLEDLSARQAADVLGISVPALKSRLYRGRRALKDRLGAAMEKAL